MKEEKNDAKFPQSAVIVLLFTTFMIDHPTVSITLNRDFFNEKTMIAHNNEPIIDLLHIKKHFILLKKINHAVGIENKFKCITTVSSLFVRKNVHLLIRNEQVSFTA